MIHVRRHDRQVAFGRTVSVRAHEREGVDQRPAPDWATPARASDFRPASEPNPDDGDWWADDDEAADSPADDYPADYLGSPWAAEGERGDDAVGRDLRLARMKQEMREWRALPEWKPSPAEPMNPQLARVLGCDTPEGVAKYERGRAYREAGYDGPLDSDNRIPDPDDPANDESLSALAAMRK